MQYLNQELAYHNRIKDDRWTKAICMQDVNLARRNAGIEEIKLTTNNQKVVTSKPRINYWIIRAKQYAKLAADYRGLAEMQQRARNNVNDVAKYMMTAYEFDQLANEMRHRSTDTNYRQYTVEV